MKNILLVLLSIPLFCAGQDGFPFSVGKEIKPTIIYYNFYNGTQIIKVDMLNYSRMQVAQMPPRALPPEMILRSMPTLNIYFIRDTSGKILQRYVPYPFDEAQLLATGKVKTVAHSQNLLPGMRGSEEELGSSIYYIHDGAKTGVMDTLGRVLLEPKFDRLVRTDSMYIVTIAGKHGVYSNEYKVVLPLEYDILEYKGHGMFLTYKDGLYTFIDRNGTVHRKMEYDDIDIVNYPIGDNNHYIYRKGDKLGLLDSLYNEVTPLRYDAIEHYENGFGVRNEDRLWALMDNEGNQLTDFKYYEVYNSINGDAHLAAKEYQGKRFFGLVGNDGKEISEFIYDRIEAFSSTHFLVAVDNKYGLMDRNGKVTVAMMYDKIDKLDDYIVAELPEGMYGIIDGNGKELLPFKNQRIKRVYNGFAHVSVDDKQFLVNLQTKKEYPFPYEDIRWFEGGLVGVYHDGKLGVVTLDGKFIVPIQYQGAYAPQNGLLRLVLNNKFGYADISGRIVIPVKYDEVYERVQEGTIIARLNGDWGCLDYKGRILIPFNYESFIYTEKRNMLFRKGSETFLFNSKGKLITKE
ncbi:WG repeat-containing protein [Flavobacterium sp. DGU11]|uniref:WG repeat-containing protein n=1 Tax=Flavobacterium arundinis TaxID=3139143 RepID=A0ABU9HSD4_9FLAO